MQYTGEHSTDWKTTNLSIILLIFVWLGMHLIYSVSQSFHLLSSILRPSTETFLETESIFLANEETCAIAIWNEDTKALEENPKCQKCAIAIWNEDTKALEENPKCPESKKMLYTRRPQTNKTLTFMLLYYNSHRHLARQVKSWKRFSEASLRKIQFVVVDDGSSLGHTAAAFFAANREVTIGLDVIVYKVDQDLDWNIGGARNLGFWMSNTPWVFMNDVDIEIKPDTMDFITDLVKFSPIQQNAVYMDFKRGREPNFKNHPAVMLIKRDHYWLVGGCDEDFVGHYGHTDPHFRLKVKLDKTLNRIVTEPLMTARKISPLDQLGHSIPCPEGISCLEPYTGKMPSRDTRRNAYLYKKKKMFGNWSNELLRFTWKREALQ